MRRPFLRFGSGQIALLTFALMRAAGAAPDPDIERLLHKLPPPEKVVRAPIQRTIEKPDATLRDPLSQNAIQQFARGNIAGAMTSVRSLRQKFPQKRRRAGAVRIARLSHAPTQ